MNVINQNEVFKKYDFSSFITREDDKEACGIIKDIIDNGNYFTNSPKYQTRENLFARSEDVWLKYRNTFLVACFTYLGKEVSVGNRKSWSFMTNLEGAEDRDRLWHHHWHPSERGMKMLSGLWYLDIPDDVENMDLCGTEIAPHGPRRGGEFFVKPTFGNWLIYPSDQWHRPGIVQSNQYRFVLAVDLEYYP